MVHGFRFRMSILSKTTLCTVIGAIVLNFSSSAFAEPVRWEAAIAHLEAAKEEIRKAQVGTPATKEQAIRHINQTIELLKADIAIIKER
jgi:hypothetical protein